MKFLILALALVAGVMADVSELTAYEYQGGFDDGGDFGVDGGYSSSVPSNSYIPPAASAPSNSYIPPVESAPVNSYIPPAASAPAPANTYIPPSSGVTGGFDGGATEFGDDGYRYKTQRRRVFRQRF